MLGKPLGDEAALFVPTGTMGNQICIRAHTQPGDEMICSDNAHIYIYEGGGFAALRVSRSLVSKTSLAS